MKDAAVTAALATASGGVSIAAAATAAGTCAIVAAVASAAGVSAVAALDAAAATVDAVDGRHIRLLTITHPALAAPHAQRRHSCDHMVHIVH